MAWAESHQAIGRHAKTLRAAKMLGINIPQMVGHLHLLWHWAIDFALDGDLTEYEVGIISDAAMWDGEPEAFISALLTCNIKPKGHGFLERDPGGRLIIHDWAEYTGGLLDSREKNRLRQQRFRDRNALRNGEKSQDVTHNAQPNQTNLTKPTDSPPISPPGGKREPQPEAGVEESATLGGRVEQAKGRRAPFKIPSLSECLDCFTSLGHPEEAEPFHDHYTANGWVIGRTPMKDWKAAARGWLRNDCFRRKQSGGLAMNGRQPAPKTSQQAFEEELEAVRRMNR